jgi:hypothetical protein
VFDERMPTPGDVARLRAEVTQLTADFRTSAASPYPRLRELLVDRGIQPDRALLVQLHSEDTNMLLGIVVTSSRRVFLFLFDFLRVPIERGEFREWTDLTGQTTDIEYRAFVEQIECGIALAREMPKPN